MTSLDVDNLALRKITAYNSDNSFVSTNSVFTVGNNGNVNWTDSLSLSSIVTSSITASSITTTNILVNGSTMIGPQGIAMYSNVTSTFTDNLTTQGEKLYFNGQEVQTGGSGNDYWDEISGKGWIVNTNIGEPDGNYYLVGIGTSTLTATLDVSGSIHANTIKTNIIDPSGTLTITNNTVIQKTATDVNFEISNATISTCQPDQPITASLTLRTMEGSYTLFNSKCDGQGLTQNNLTLYSYFGADTPIFDIDPSGNITAYNEINIRPQVDNQSGKFTIYNASVSTKPVYFETYVSGNSGGGLTTGNFELYGHSGVSYSTIRKCVDIAPEGNSVILGDSTVVGGCVVNVNGTLGPGRVYDTVYNQPLNNNIQIISVSGSPGAGTNNTLTLDNFSESNIVILFANTSPANSVFNIIMPTPPAGYSIYGFIIQGSDISYNFKFKYGATEIGSTGTYGALFYILNSNGAYQVIGNTQLTPA
jgi:hypothetical protein